MDAKVLNRNSSIELLKVISILLIVMNHTVCSLCEPNHYLASQPYLLDFTASTTNVQYLFSNLFRYCIGNTLFFLSSAWFLLDDNRVKKVKVINMMLDIWLISMIYLVSFMLSSQTVEPKFIVRSIFPTLFANNWFLTCYILFYILHPYFNIVIKTLDQKSLLHLTAFLGITYIVIQSIHNGHFFATRLTEWTAMYFIIGHIKNCKSTICGVKNGGVMTVMGLVGLLMIYFFVNFIGLRVPMLSHLMACYPGCQIFMLILCMGLLFIAVNFNMHIKWINYISSCSMLVYIIHENILVRNYMRPKIWGYIYDNIGYDYLYLEVILIGISIFVCSLLCATIYKYTAGRLTNKTSNLIDSAFQRSVWTR